MKIESTGQVRETFIENEHSAVWMTVCFVGLNDDDKHRMMRLMNKNAVFRIYFDELGQKKLGDELCLRQE